jgi:hypothetical protein
MARTHNLTPPSTALGFKRDDLVVETGEAAGVLGNQKRLEASVAVARRVDPQLALVGQDRLGGAAVALVGGGVRPLRADSPDDGAVRRSQTPRSAPAGDPESRHVVQMASAGEQKPSRPSANPPPAEIAHDALSWERRRV